MTKLRKQQISEIAHNLGFDAIGFAKADHADPEGHFQAWLDAGYHADLHYLAKRAKERMDPRLFFPEVQTVVMLAMFYRFPSPVLRENSGKISCYAWGSDYHRVIIKKIRKLRKEINVLAPTAKIYGEVDTGPILEKFWAERAGLGWIAKNANLLSQKGSWLFLAAVLTDLVLPPDSPGQNHCGTCRLCIDECPTQAIVSPGVVDSRRCISYLTIENKGPIPRHLRASIGSWIFGCDDCQTVCPWQKFDPGGREPKFQPREKVLQPDLLQLLQLDEEVFRETFAGTPIARAKRRGMRRNAIVALGNQKPSKNALLALQKILQQDPDDMLRGHAAWAIGRLGDYQTLSRQKQIETHKEVLEEIQEALAGNQT